MTAWTGGIARALCALLLATGAAAQSLAPDVAVNKVINTPAWPAVIKVINTPAWPAVMASHEKRFAPR